MPTALFARIKASLTSLFGILFIVYPTGLMALFGVELTAGGELMTRLLGIVLIGICIELWFVKSTCDIKPQAAMGYSVTDLLGVAFVTLAILNGSLNALGWILVLSYALSSAGFAACYFNHKRSDKIQQPLG